MFRPILLPFPWAHSFHSSTSNLLPFSLFLSSSFHNYVSTLATLSPLHPTSPMGHSQCYYHQSSPPILPMVSPLMPHFFHSFFLSLSLSLFLLFSLFPTPFHTHFLHALLVVHATTIATSHCQPMILLPSTIVVSLLYLFIQRWLLRLLISFTTHDIPHRFSFLLGSSQLDSGPSSFTGVRWISSLVRASWGVCPTSLESDELLPCIEGHLNGWSRHASLKF